MKYKMRKILLIIILTSPLITKSQLLPESKFDIDFKRLVETGKSNVTVIQKNKNKIVEQHKLDKERKVTFSLYYNVDVVNNIDSVFYKYDNSGNPLEKRKINIDVPEGEEQKMTSKEFGSVRKVSTSKYYYDSQNHLIKTEYFFNEKSSIPDIDRYFYNNKGMKVGHERISRILPKENNYKESFYYDDKYLVKTNLVYNSKPNDTLSSLKEYKNGRIVKEIDVNRRNSEKIEYEYTKEGLLAVKKVYGTFLNEVYVNKTEFKYNNLGQLSEKKFYSNDELKYWESYKYNNDGLKIEEIWFDLKDLTPKYLFSIIYE